MVRASIRFLAVMLSLAAWLRADEPRRDLDWWSLKELPGTARLVDGHPVDHFVGAGLVEHGLEPVGPADAETLIRRMTYDLTGLPPAPDETEAFVAAHAENADQSIVALADRLLASPAFGEKWGQHWLDLARYAETHGYDKDKPRENAWPYRDYVIRSFNEDKPYDRFVREQVAGDVLFPGEPDGVLGLGFLAAGPWDLIGHEEVGEGKLDGRIAKHLDRDEMIAAIFNVFQSITVQCAQCHHHKSDPVLMEDYYRLHAVFAAVDRAARVYEGLTPEEEKEKREFLAKVNGLRREQARLGTEIKRLVAAKTSGLDRRIAELKEKYGTGDSEGQRPQFGYHSRIMPKADAVKWVQVDLGERRAVAQLRIIPAFDKFGGIGAGFGFPVRYRVEATADSPDFTEGVRMLLDATGEDQPNPGMRTVAVDVGGAPVRYIRVTATKLAKRTGDYIFALGELEALNADEDRNFAAGAQVTALDSIEAKVRWGRKNLVDGVYYRELDNSEAVAELHELQARRKEVAAKHRPADADRRLEEIGKEVTALEKKLRSFPEGKKVYAAATQFKAAGRFVATNGKPRPVHVLDRGDLRAPGEAMTPGAPPLWAGAPERFFEQSGWDEGEARAELARYLTRVDNPLVWRSIANRAWQWTFGAPLAGTPNDFGRMGQEPTHPELLDYLAARLRDDPRHSIKSLVRLLVTSEAYRRASGHDEANAKIDSGNRFLWRANRRRLTAEEFRDAVLAVSGALRDHDRGGRSFRDFVIEKPTHSPHYEYHLHDPEDAASHRRSIYRFVVRSQPQPMLTTLDCADPSMSVPARDESTTALQALTQWNHRFVETMARRFAERMRMDGTDSSEARVESACRLALGRAPDGNERSVLVGHLREHGEESLARVLFNMNAFTYLD